MTVAVAPISGETVLNQVDAQRITSNIRAWVNSYPLEDVKRAYFGRVWLALGYESWSEWCDCELGGFKLPAVERREVVSELTDAGVSGEAIADVLDVSNATVSRDRGLTNVRPDTVIGQDGKTYSNTTPKEKPWRFAVGEPDEIQQQNWRTTFASFKAYTDVLAKGLSGDSRLQMLAYLRSLVKDMENQNVAS